MWSLRANGNSRLIRIQSCAFQILTLIASKHMRVVHRDAERRNHGRDCLRQWGAALIG
jgi:hypothetical protein